jgi:phosphoglucomutase
MNDINSLYALWSEKAVLDADLAEELSSINGNQDEILDRFYRNLEFGTAGLRGVLGAGTNRMNIYTVNQATQGLADYLNEAFEDPSVAIAYDSRIKSDLFAREAAGVLAANGIKVYIYPELVPTPMLSFAVRRLKCSSGIIITASHNPAKYNGYKCYDPNGYQMTDEAAQRTYEYIQKVDMFDGVKRTDFDEALKDGIIEYIEPWLYEEFYSEVEKTQVNPGICKTAGLKVIYTPLNGTGNKPVREILKRIGISDVRVVPEQEKPDGNFPTCPFPNPEIKQVFECAIEMTKTDRADLLLATDPDCDRMGIAVFDGSDYVLMSGNEVGVMFTEYLLSSRAANGTMPKDPIVVKTIVTTKLVEKVAASYGAECVDLLTGFKYIGELITNLEKKNEADRFIVGMEESYGYLSGIHARDKDAVVASMLLCEMAAYYKSKGMTLVDLMNSLYEKYGMYLNTLLNFNFEGATGMQKMSDMMTSLRENPPKQIAGQKVVAVADYKTSERTDIETGEKSVIDLPKSNVLSYSLPDGSGAIVRPSGTEPKIKIYITAVADTKENAQIKADEIGESMKKIMGV